MNLLVVIDTEFIFALRKSDPLHEKAKKVLASNTSLTLTVPSLIETVLVLLSSGKTESQIINFLETTWEIIAKYNITSVNYYIDQLIEGLKIKRDHGKGGLFDSLIAGSARTIDNEILSNDKAFDGILGLKRITFDQFLAPKTDKNVRED